MAFLTLGGTNIPIAASSKPAVDEVEIGDRARAIDGTMRETITARKREWHLETIPSDATAAGVILAALVAASPVVANGDLLGNVAANVFVSYKLEMVAVRGGFQTVFQITLMEQ